MTGSLLSLRHLVRPLAPLAVIWAAACGGDGGTAPASPAQPNRAPTAAGSIPAQNMTAGESVTVSVAGIFSDPDGDAMTFTAISSNSGVAGVALSGTDLTIAAAAAGTATVTVTARDPAGLSAAASANVTVVEPNRAPRANVPVAPALTAVVRDTISLDATPFFTDPDGDALTYSATSTNASVVTASASGSVVSAVAVGAGSTTLTVTATDPDGLSGSVSVPVTVEPNRPPEATQESLSFPDVQERNSATLNLDAHFTDPNGQALVYEAESNDRAVATVAVSGSTLTVTAVAVGTATITVTAADPFDLTASLSGAVTVIERVNQAPEAQSEISSITRTVGWTGTENLEGDPPLFLDPDGDDLVYSAESSDSAVANATASGSELTLTAVAVGTATITVAATDPGGLSASVDFELTVLPAATTAFRDDFDDEASLDDWTLGTATVASVSEGVLRMTNDSTGLWATAARTQNPPLASWEIRVRLARARADSMRTAVLFTATNPGEYDVRWLRLEIGSNVLNFAEPETVNYALAAYFTPPDRDEGLYYLNGLYGTSGAIDDGAGEFTEIAIRAQNGRLEVLAGTERIAIAVPSPPFASALSEIDQVYMQSFDPETANPGLFDWIEINGVPAESGSAATGEFGVRMAVPPMDAARDSDALLEAPPQAGGNPRDRRRRTPGRR